MAVGNLDTLIQEQKGEVTTGELPVLEAEEVLIVQLFQNLISNAIRFRSAAPPKIHVTAKKQNDNGIGIDPQYKESIFDIFKRLHPQAKYGGSGIGLSICKRIVERHGGRIWVDSTSSSGSTLAFSFPAR